MNAALTTSPPANAWWKSVLSALGLCCLGLLAYRTSFVGAFQYDDGLCIVQSAAIDEWWPAQAFTTGNRRWFTHFTLVANYKLHQLQVYGYHVVNFAIHLSGACLLLGLVRRSLLLPATRERYAASAGWLALAIAALWLVHPLQTESVTYIVQRLESLAGLCFLLTLYAVLRGSQASRGWPWYLLAVLAIVLGFGAKETMFVAPLVVLAYDRIFLSATWRELVRRRGWMYLAMLPSIVWAGAMLKASFTPGANTMMGFAFRGVSPWEYLRSQPAVLLHYLRLSVWPDQQCLDYDWPIEQSPLRIYGLGLVIVALLGCTLWALWKQPRLGFLGLAFFVILAPTSSFMPIRDLAFEHRMYLPLAVVLTLMVLGLNALCERCLRLPAARVALPATAILLAIAALTLQTSARNRLYADPVLLWQDVLVVAPHNVRAHYNLAQSISNRGLVNEGRDYYLHLLRHDPLAIELRAQSADRLVIDAEQTLAIAHYRQALALNPQEPRVHFNLGGLYERAGDHDQAIDEYRQELAIHRGHLFARLNLARLLAERDEVSEAIAQYRQASQLHPRDARPLYHLGNLHADQREWELALECYRAALAKNPQHVNSRYRAGLALWELGDERAAIAELRELRRTQRADAQASLALARQLALTNIEELRNPAEGAAIAQQVLDHEGTSDAEAWRVSAICLAELQRYAEALARFDRALELANARDDQTLLAALRAERAALREAIINTSAP